MLISDFFTAMNAEIEMSGFDNLDFLKNLGHSIERHLDDRRYLDETTESRLGNLEIFTFEPHIGRADGGVWGFKHEEIYRFVDGSLTPVGTVD